MTGKSSSWGFPILIPLTWPAQCQNTQPQNASIEVPYLHPFSWTLPAVSWSSGCTRAPGLFWTWSASWPHFLKYRHFSTHKRSSQVELKMKIYKQQLVCNKKHHLLEYMGSAFKALILVYKTITSFRRSKHIKETTTLSTLDKDVTYRKITYHPLAHNKFNKIFRHHNIVLTAQNKFSIKKSFEFQLER